ncbi:metallophosphoesterase [Streptomyces sp. RY43-2]|uniref:Metallophosphoesterase n=1 Tax=Streptomyces macrolidinus TaxID=2952607 RepID=A0ABT0Z8H6_9ACTN|nr:SAV_2336 N-terminal domain-related protein [Streptomyces macrolidinus]MCN9240069.1 metallophosphoesterase [Streptomyces macrolidinus]
MTSRAPGPLADAVSPALTALVARLRDAGIVPGVEELADALWLAHWLPATTERSDPAEEVVPGGSSQRPDDTGPLPPSARLPRLPAEHTEPQPPDAARLFAPEPGETGTAVPLAPIGVPTAPALPEPLALQRGLRPLQRYRAPVRPVPRVLDETATAERAAESGLVLPVLRTDRRREARMLLVMDVSTSTVVWQQALDELQQVCARAGAFREVQVQYLHEAPGGLPGCSATPEPTGPLHAPEQLSDPTGRRVTLVLSDCAGPMWRGGAMQRLLHRWAATAPVAVVQPLPQRMWLRTHLPARRGLLHRREGPAGALEFRPERGRTERGALPVPVLALRRASVEGWARLVSGATGQSLDAAAGWVRADHAPSAAPVRAAADLSGAERVRAFWRPASSEARRLAVYLTAVPLHLPVMQLVQHAMLARSGPDVLSEVLLSGLVRRREDTGRPDGVRYEFLPGVATELRTRLTVEDAELLFKHCSEYVGRKFGRSVRNFPALAGAFLHGAVLREQLLSPTGGPGEDEPVGLRAFAEVSAEVLRDLGARMPVVPVRPELSDRELLERGRAALARFGREGLTRELDAAVEYLRRATGVARTQAGQGAAHEALAQGLLARWQVRGVGEDLREAWESLDGRRPLSPDGRLVRGLVCWAQARKVRTRGIGFPGIPDSLREWAGTVSGSAEDHAYALLLYVADRDLTSVLSDGGMPERLSTAGGTLAEVRRALAEAGPGTGEDLGPEEWYVLHLLRAAVAAGVRIDLGLSEPAHLVRGRIWLDLARHYQGKGPIEGVAPDTERAADLASRAAGDLLVAADDGSGLSAAEHCRAWLDLASAEEIADRREPERLAHVLEHALITAGGDPELRLECHMRAARIHRARFRRTKDPAELDSAIAAWTDAEWLLSEDDPRRPAVLADFGAALIHRSGTPARSQDVAKAIDLLRRAVDESPPDDPELPRRRGTLAYAHVLRYGAQLVQSDLYEAEWLFGEAIRGSDDQAFLAKAWMSRGAALVLLAAHADARPRQNEALDCFSRAAVHARAAGDEELLADAHEARGRVREQLGEPEAALTEFRTALDLTGNPDTIDALRTHISRLAPEAPEE